MWPFKKSKNTIGKGIKGRSFENGSKIKPNKISNNPTGIPKLKLNIELNPNKPKPKAFKNVLRSKRVIRASPNKADNRRKEAEVSTNEAFTTTSKNIRLSSSIFQLSHNSYCEARMLVYFPDIHPKVPSSKTICTQPVSSLTERYSSPGLILVISVPPGVPLTLKNPVGVSLITTIFVFSDILPCGFMLMSGSMLSLSLVFSMKSPSIHPSIFL